MMIDTDEMSTREGYVATCRSMLKSGNAAFRGQMIQRYSIAGTWSIEGDSLVKVFDMKFSKSVIQMESKRY